MAFRIKLENQYLVDYFCYYYKSCVYMFEYNKSHAEIFIRRINAVKTMERIRFKSYVPPIGKMEIESFSCDIELVMGS